MFDGNGAWARQGEAFWRAHHEAWKRSDLNQRQLSALMTTRPQSKLRSIMLAKSLQTLQDRDVRVHHVSPGVAGGCG